MKYIIESDKFTDEQAQDLLKVLKELSDQMHQLRMYGERQRRASTLKKDKPSKLVDEYEEYFYSMMDDGWDYFTSGVEFVSHVYLKKPIMINGVEKEFDHIVREMTEIKNRFIDDGFNCHFLIFFDGSPQQELNMTTHKTDDYKFKGIGNKKWLESNESLFPSSKFPRNEYFLAKIEFIYI